MVSLLSNRQIASPFRRHRLPLSLVRLEDRTVPSAVISVNPPEQLGARELLNHGSTGSVKLGIVDVQRYSPTDFYMDVNQRVGLNRRNDQIGITLVGGREELNRRLGEANGPLMGYTIVHTLGNFNTFILQSPTTNAAETLTRLAGTLNGGYAGPVFTPPGSVDWAISTNEVIVRFNS